MLSVSQSESLLKVACRETSSGGPPTHPPSALLGKHLPFQAGTPGSRGQGAPLRTPAGHVLVRQPACDLLRRSCLALRFSTIPPEVSEGRVLPALSPGPPPLRGGPVWQGGACVRSSAPPPPRRRADHRPTRREPQPPSLSQECPESPLRTFWAEARWPDRPGFAVLGSEVATDLSSLVSKNV